MRRPHSSLLTREVYEKAESAARRGDRVTFDECVYELQHHRKGGDDLIEDLTELHGLRETSSPPIDLERTFNLAEIEGALTLLTDDGCHRRRDLLSDARHSIWLSTYTLKDHDEKLRSALTAKVRNGVAVQLIVSPGRRSSRSAPVTDGSHAADVIKDLRRAGVRVALATNHTKCVIVDDEHVMLGSANLHSSIYRDVVLQFRSRAIAKHLVEYLTAVAADESDGADG